MKTHILTFNNLVEAKINGIINNLFFKIALPDKKTPGFEFLGSAKASSVRKAGFVSFCRKDGKKVFMKKHQYKFKDMDYLYILNEASILSMLKSHIGCKFNSGPGTIVCIGNFLESKDTGSTIYIATSFAEGKMLIEFSEDEKILVLQSCIKVVGELFGKLPNHAKKNISKRGTMSFFLSFPVLGLKLTLRDLKLLPMFLKCSLLFYKNFLSSLNEKSMMSLTHRDLNKENILYDKKTKTATIIDWENTVITDNLYDLATLPWLYANWISEGKLISFLSGHLKTNSSKKRFIALAIYHAIQCISVYNKGSIHYRDVLLHTTKFINRTAGLILAPNSKVKSLKLSSSI